MTYAMLGNAAIDWLYQIGILHGRVLIILALSLYLIRTLKGSAARKHSFITAAFVAALFLPLTSQWLPPYVIELEIDQPISSISTDGSRSTVANPTVIPRWQQELPLLLFCGYWAISILLIFRIIFGNYKVARLKSRAKLCGLQQWHDTLKECTALIGLPNPVEIRHSIEITSPMTWGYLRPIILIPTSALQWPDTLRRSALLHELAHIKRKDCFTKQIVRCVCALYWINPVCWLAQRQFNIAAESASDDMALNCGIRYSHYAQNLLQVAKQANQQCATWAAALPMALTVNRQQRSQFGERVLAILNPEGCRAPINWSCLGLTFALVFGLLLPLSSLRASVVQKINYVVTQPNNLIPMPPPVSPAGKRIIKESKDSRELGRDGIVERDAEYSAANETTVSPQTLDPNLEPKPNVQESVTVEYVEIPPAEVIERAKRKVKQTLAGIHNDDHDNTDTNNNSEAIKTTPASNTVATSHNTQPTGETSTSPTDVSQPIDIAQLMQNHHATEHLLTESKFINSETLRIEPYAAERIVTPQYPHRARSRGIEGELTVEFSINSFGQVVDVKIINAQPSGVFDRAVLKALQQNRYIPQRIDGRPVAVSGLQEKYVFVLES